MEPKHLYTIKWTQPYYQSNSFLAELHALYMELVEVSLDEGHFEEANAEIARIMAL